MCASNKFDSSVFRMYWFASISSKSSPIARRCSVSVESTDSDSVAPVDPSFFSVDASSSSSSHILLKSSNGSSVLNSTVAFSSSVPESTLSSVCDSAEPYVVSSTSHSSLREAFRRAMAPRVALRFSYPFGLLIYSSLASFKIESTSSDDSAFASSLDTSSISAILPSSSSCKPNMGDVGIMFSTASCSEAVDSSVSVSVSVFDNSSSDDDENIPGSMKGMLASARASSHISSMVKLFFTALFRR
mmetsp:Transcript_38522/g.93197  ORF Transcript_38522/g.93197 Transcript_38522/m.93197 type:complete len:245 (-) Transcript_38522:424-1158(-)